MRTTTSLLVGAAMFASTLIAAAPQAGAPSTIVFINGDQILEGSTIGRGAREQLEAAAASWQERINGVNDELLRLQTQRNDQALTLNETALARMNQDIEERQVQVQRLNDDARRELQRLEQQITVDVNSQLGPLVERFAVDNGYEMIFDTSRLAGVLYFSTNRDVTSDFLAVVNAGPASGAAQ